MIGKTKLYLLKQNDYNKMCVSNWTVISHETIVKKAVLWRFFELRI